VATIRDVARLAGVSPTTVSRAMSGTSYVSAEVRTRVEHAVEELGFVPNGLARGLKTRRSGIITLLIPEIVNSFYTTIVRGVEDVANHHGRQVIVGNTDERVDKERAYVDVVIGSRSDGVIVAPAGRTSRHLRRLVDHDIPTVLIDRPVDGFPADIVRGDNIGGAIALTNHLLSLGHRDIALINGDLETSTARLREDGFRQAMHQAGYAIDDRLLSAGTWFVEDAERRVTELLTANVPFSAIFGANNFMAIGALRALRHAGLQVPGDIAVVCFDEIEVATQIDPFLTVMAQPAYTMGMLAMQLLIDRLDATHNHPPREVVLPPQLIVRRSCGATLALPTNPQGVDNEPAGLVGKVTRPDSAPVAQRRSSRGELDT
jgi:LacI family transcriptional regulator